MAVSIKSNLQSLQAQRQLAQTGKEAGRVLERLSSGMRINRASDDAAGLAIAETLNAKSRVYAVGIRNLNDGISMLSIADSAVGSLTDITVRLKELAEQSANGTYSAKQREAVDNEAQALSKEFTRIAQSTSFNGLNLFDGSVQNVSLQAGFGTNGVISSTLGGAIGDGTFNTVITANAESIANDSVIADFDGDGVQDIVTASFDSSLLLLQLGNGDGTFKEASTLDFGGYLALRAADINNDGKLDVVGVQNQGGMWIGTYFQNDGKGSFLGASTFSSSLGASAFSLADINNDGNIDVVQSDSIYFGNGKGTFSAPKSTGLPALGYQADTIDFDHDGFLDLAVSGGSSSLNLYKGNGSGSFTFTRSLSTPGFDSVTYGDIDSDGYADIITANSANHSLSIFFGDQQGAYTRKRVQALSGSSPVSVALTDVNGDGILDIISGDTAGGADILTGNGDGTFVTQTKVGASIQTLRVVAGDFNGDGVADFALLDADKSNIYAFIGTTRSGVGALQQFSLKTSVGSLQALSAFSNKLNVLSSQRAQIGAFQSRLSTATNVLQSSRENFQAAESRIRDTDIAKDSAEIARLGILQKAGVSVLAQANLQPDIALKLLQR